MAGRASTIGLLLCIAALTGCGDRFPDYNYKMTVHAGGQQFSSVRHVEVTEGMSIISRKVEGEAVVIDRNGRTYYALLSRPENADYAAFVAGMALGDHVPRDDPQRSEVQQAIDEWYEERSTQDSFGEAAEFLQAMVKVEGAQDLPRTLPPRRNREPTQAWPMFVTFSNPSDPRTVSEVSPEAIGVDRITIEITDEDVTTGIEKRLPNFGPESGFQAWARDLEFDDPIRSVLGGFRQE